MTHPDRPRLRIAVLAHCRHPIAPPFMGGMEAHAHALARGLQARGHDVTLIASGDSAGDVPLIPLMDRHYDADYPWHQWHGTPVLNAHLDRHHQACLERVAGMGFDIIHNNSLHRFPPRMARAARVPMVTSLHVPPFDTLLRAVRDSIAPWHLVTGCSASHLAGYFPEGPPDHAHVLANGIDPAAWPFSPQGDGSAIWAGRITPDKAPHLAIRAARRAGLPLRLHGVVEDRPYFDRMIRPHLSDGIRFDGHLPSDGLARALGRASVLLFTPQWDEPFGLTAIEAMACGTPVAAIPRGAVAEVLGPAGRLSDPEGGDLDRALIRALRIPRHLPRDRVLAHFSLDAMIDRLELLYRRAIAARDMPAPPVAYPPIALPPGLVRATT